MPAKSKIYLIGDANGVRVLQFIVSSMENFNLKNSMKKLKSNNNLRRKESVRAKKKKETVKMLILSKTILSQERHYKWQLMINLLLLQFVIFE
jgi:hypothetical protein